MYEILSLKSAFNKLISNSLVISSYLSLCWSYITTGEFPTVFVEEIAVHNWNGFQYFRRVKKNLLNLAKSKFHWCSSNMKINNNNNVFFTLQMLPRKSNIESLLSIS